MDVKTYHANAAEIYCFWREVGLSDAQALGMLANADAESSLDPEAVGDHKTAFGLHQMHRDRISVILTKIGIDISMLPPIADQLRGVWWELNYVELKALGKLRAATTAYDAGAVVCSFYERPKLRSEASRRGKMAQKWAAFFAAHPPAIAPKDNV